MMAIEKVIYLKVVGEKYIIWGQSAQKLKVAHPINCFPGFSGKNIKNCPPSKLFLFTSLTGRVEFNVATPDTRPLHTAYGPGVRYSFKGWQLDAFSL